MEYITTKDASKKWGISPTRITILANEGRIPGAKRLGRSWLIPASATKPVQYKSGHSKEVMQETDKFSFPLYHFRPDWSDAQETCLSEQQKNLLIAETAVLECRYEDAYPILTTIMSAPQDINSEIGCLWNAGICCIALNNPTEFSKIFMRLQMIFAEDFPHRNELITILNSLKTYIDTMVSMADTDNFDTEIHNQAVPVTCVLLGYKHLAFETMNPGSANIAWMELNLRFLENTGALIAVEMMHCFLIGIYYLRQNMNKASKHADAVVKLAYENKLYFPLITYYRYFAHVFAPILNQYPENFKEHIYTLISKYEENSTAFSSSISEYAVLSTFTDAELPYIYGILIDLNNSSIASKLKVHPSTVNRKIQSICEELGVKNKKELREYLRNYI